MKILLNGIFNIGTGNGISVRSVAKIIVKRINTKLKIDFLPTYEKPVDIILNNERAKLFLGFSPKL